MPTGTFPNAGTITVNTDIDPVQISAGDQLRYTVKCTGNRANFSVVRVSDGGTLWQVANADPSATFIHTLFPSQPAGANSDRYGLVHKRRFSLLLLG